jgi:hypothetical protein
MQFSEHLKMKQLRQATQYRTKNTIDCPLENELFVILYNVSNKEKS